jgi:glycosyltransferase involved in cell wall biosynthesis
MRIYPGLKINFISPAFICALRKFAPHVIHLVDPMWLGVQALTAITLLFPATPVVTSHHTNLPTYAAVFGYPYYPYRTWQVHAYFHSFARCTLVPSASTADLLAERGFANLRVVSRGADFSLFNVRLHCRLRATQLTARCSLLSALYLSGSSGSVLLLPLTPRRSLSPPPWSRIP